MLDSLTKDQYIDFEAWGLSTYIDLHNCDSTLLISVEAIREYTGKICEVIDAKPWGPCYIQNFGENSDVFGYSMMQLVESSLVSAHFVNKTNRIFVDIFSCKYYDPGKAVEFSKKFFKAKDATYKCVMRK